MVPSRSGTGVAVALVDADPRRTKRAIPTTRKTATSTQPMMTKAPTPFSDKSSLLLLRPLSEAVLGDGVVKLGPQLSGQAPSMASFCVAHEQAVPSAQVKKQA